MSHSPSQLHSNRQPYNWLAYRCGDKALMRHECLYSGDVFDLGCGEMPYKGYFLQFAKSYTGVDWAESLHELKADVFANLNEPLPIEDAVADTVISLSVMEHLSEPQTMLNEAFRILRPGGHMVLQVPFMWHIHEAPYDFYRYTCYGLEYMFKKAGFEDINVEATTGFWSMWLLKLNYQTIRLIRGPSPLRLLIRGVFIPLWWLDQMIALLLDHFWTSEQETAGYFVTARKP